MSDQIKMSDQINRYLKRMQTTSAFRHDKRLTRCVMYGYIQAMVDYGGLSKENEKTMKLKVLEELRSQENDKK